jgi:hypothetical protein
MKSGLNAQILAQVWALADVNRDGKLDRYEFAIAMTLIRRCMAGMQLPPTLPPTLRNIIGQPPPPMFPVRPPSGPPIMPQSYSAGPSVPLKQCTDWSLPLPSKNKYREQFYNNDKQNIGIMNGVQSRYILSQSGLPTPILADIWNLSDVNKDGCLSPDEFCVAMHLIDMHKMGYALPKELPPELLDLFPNARRQSNDSPSIAGQIKKASYEDKFADSYQRGQAELERRRQIAREEEERLRAESERREREERERRERERQEIERRREAEREAERQRELEREKARQEEEAKLLAEREAIRKKLEEERMKELEKIRIRELENQKETESEKTAQIQQRLKNMTFQLQALQEKSDSLNNEVTKARDEIIAITSEIEGMRAQRDEKLALMSQMQQSHQQLSIQCERVSHEHLQLQSECRLSINRAEEIENLRKVIVEKNEEIAKVEEEIVSIREKVESQGTSATTKRPEFEKSNEEFAQLVEEYNEMARRAIARQEELRRKAAEKARASFMEKQASFPTSFPPQYETPLDAFDNNVISPIKTETSAFSASNIVPPPSSNQVPYNNGFENSFTSSVVSTATSAATATSTSAATKYRALYEFVARTDDEISLQPGDEILVFDSQNGSEPGWLAGQIRGKVGWFPAAFAEPIIIGKKSSILSIVTSPSSEPLASIKEDPNERDIEPFAAFGKNVGPVGNYDTPPALSALSLYEQPPIEDTLASPSKETPSVTTTTTTLPAYDAPPGDVVTSVSTLSAYDTPPATDEKVLAIGTALYRWNAQKEGDLSFSKGDEIEILEQAEMKWRGRLYKDASIQGWFPKSYVKIIDKASSKQSPTVPTSPKSESNGASKEDGEWYIALWGFEAVEPTDLTIKPGDRIWVIERQEQWWKGVLDGQTGIFPATYVEKATVVKNPTIATDSVKDSIARALVDYEATAENQISLKVGDLVKIRSTSPAGWWEGEIQLPSGENKTGWFPGNYVELVSPTAANAVHTNGHGN